MNETPVNDITENTHNVITVSVEDGDDLIDMHTEGGEAATDLRMTIQEALALIASLTSAIGTAITAR